jgi:hypothetical protein
VQSILTAGPSAIYVNEGVLAKIKTGLKICGAVYHARKEIASLLFSRTHAHTPPLSLSLSLSLYIYIYIYMYICYHIPPVYMYVYGVLLSECSLFILVHFRS